MGRPRKRRREGEADEPVELPTEDRIGHGTILNDFPAIASYSDIGLVSPPHLQDSDQVFGMTTTVPPSSHDLGLSDAFGLSPISSLE